MEYHAVKDIVRTCPILEGLSEDVRASIFWHGEERQVAPGEVVYEQDTELDDTFCLLLDGAMLVEQKGREIGQIQPPQAFGEMAFFTTLRARTATVRAGSRGATFLRIRLKPEILGEPSHAELKRHLGVQAWDRFVNTSQAGT